MCIKAQKINWQIHVKVLKEHKKKTKGCNNNNHGAPHATAPKQPQFYEDILAAFIDAFAFVACVVIVVVICRNIQLAVRCDQQQCKSLMKTTLNLEHNKAIGDFLWGYEIAKRTTSKVAVNAVATIYYIP